MGDQPITRPLPTQDSTTQKNADIQPCLKQWFEPTTPVLEQLKTTCALDHAATGTGN